MSEGIGHNGGPLMGEARDKLKSFLDRYEVLADEAGAIREAVKELGAEVKGKGFDVPALKKIVALRGKDKTKVLAQKEMLELYAHALGVEDLV